LLDRTGSGPSACGAGLIINDTKEVIEEDLAGMQGKIMSLVEAAVQVFRHTQTRTEHAGIFVAERDFRSDRQVPADDRPDKPAH
jgi:hypothetical protein